MEFDIIFFGRPGLGGVLRTLTHDIGHNGTEHVLVTFAAQLSALTGAAAMPTQTRDTGDESGTEITGIQALVALLEFTFAYITFAEETSSHGPDAARSRLRLALVECSTVFNAYLKHGSISNWRSSMSEWCATRSQTYGNGLETSILRLGHASRLTLEVMGVCCGGVVKLLKRRAGEMEHSLAGSVELVDLDKRDPATSPAYRLTEEDLRIVKFNSGSVGREEALYTILHYLTQEY
ncbi:hypothetical protein NKR23_g10935 [Pleurostoma richardsiae]|uniref:Uncharacterized protein n=1 Tax=Pleurostoma richardsiae TaxID=41990 RepID=A0AA38RBU2_9PEZI|nr:hypothetical protein NKR23_g10935 [Pleurostoma richardsiae]